jgi:uncharacterized protein (TIGR03435 family)
LEAFESFMELCRRVRVSAVIAVLIAAASVCDVSAQALRVAPAAELPAFEAAVVKPADPSKPAPRVVSPDRVHRPVTTAMELITDAFAVQRNRVVNAPEWAANSRFEVLAKTPGPATTAQTLPYLQRLLFERFGLQAHVETRELPYFALVPADRADRLGARMTPTKEDCAAVEMDRKRSGIVGPQIPRAMGQERPVCFSWFYSVVGNDGVRAMRIMSGGMTPARLADFLSGPAGRVVLDRTGLEGAFDIDLQYALVNAGAAAPTPTSGDEPDVFTAVQEQLGLRLTSGRGPVEVLVIDKLTQPTEN